MAPTNKRAAPETPQTEPQSKRVATPAKGVFTFNNRSLTDRFASLADLGKKLFIFDVSTLSWRMCGISEAECEKWLPLLQSDNLSSKDIREIKSSGFNVCASIALQPIYEQVMAELRVPQIGLHFEGNNTGLYHINDRISIMTAVGISVKNEANVIVGDKPIGCISFRRFGATEVFGQR